MSTLSVVMEWALSLNGTVIDNYNDLCVRLISTLMDHYNKLGFDYSTKQDTEIGCDMYMKTYVLCNILYELVRNSD